ncbi:MAG TPA: hypothetical protein PKL97_01940 [Candidatus Omnitrophota bacterium]|nr:hypothetical protein [Candidatus Omnitrophota bacterium]
MGKSSILRYLSQTFSITSDSCPKCGGDQIRYSSVWWRNFERFMRGSKRRYCKTCGNKWFSKRQIGISELKKKILFLAILAIIAVFIGVLLNLFMKPSASDLAEQELMSVETQVEMSTPLSS